jgi:hypothetical protein
VSDQGKCPACRVRSIEYPTAGGIVDDRSCTGRAGCVRHPERENSTPESGPAGVNVPDGKADIVEQDEPHVAAAIEAVRGVERGELMAHLGPRVVVLPKEEHDRYYEIVVQQRAEIARLRVEVGRLTRQVDHWIGCARATETHAARLEDRRADLAARVAELEAEVERWKDRAHHAEGAVAVLNRTIDDLNGESDARDLAVAEAVREACRAKAEAIGEDHSRRNRFRPVEVCVGGPEVAEEIEMAVHAIDLAAVLAGVGEDG